VLFPDGLGGGGDGDGGDGGGGLGGGGAGGALAEHRSCTDVCLGTPLQGSLPPLRTAMSASNVHCACPMQIFRNALTAPDPSHLASRSKDPQTPVGRPMEAKITSATRRL
jgi:hypothetical protein